MYGSVPSTTPASVARDRVGNLFTSETTSAPGSILFLAAQRHHPAARVLEKSQKLKEQDIALEPKTG